MGVITLFAAWIFWQLPPDEAAGEPLPDAIAE
jgi:hypothetical protein